MKILMTTNEPIFNNFQIARIYIVDNAATATLDNLYIAASTSDDLYMEYDDSELLSLTEGEIRAIQKEEVLDRLYDLYLDGKFKDQPLTGKQLRKLSDWYKFGNPKDIVTDIEPILESIKAAIFVNKPYDRTSPDEQWKNYAQTKGIDLNMDDYLMFLKALNKDQFMREIKSKNAKHLGNRLLEFELTGSYTTHDGTELSAVKIYIKIEKQIENGHIVLISFHDPEVE